MLVAVVIGGHVAVLALFAIHQRDSYEPADDRMTLIFFDPLDETNDSRPADAPTRPAVTRRATLESRPPTAQPAPDDATAIVVPQTTPGVDWYTHAADAARRAATEPTTRDFGFPRSEPAPRQKKEFRWDKTHTERVHALAGGGIGIHLSDNCELVIAPFPMAGCAFGKRKARGDLFDEMKAPVEAGDWKDR